MECLFFCGKIRNKGEKMKKSKKWSLMLLCVLVGGFVVFSGCIFDSGGDDGDTSGGNENPTTVSLNDCYVQKGPFTSGSSVSIQELDDDFNPTGISYSTSTIDDFGSFTLSSTINTNYIEITSQGFYFDEVQGAISTSQITLRVITEVSNLSSININILTTLEKERVQYLITEQDKTFSEAKSIADEEILEIFKIPSDIISDISSFEKMDISKEGDSNAILLAISIILQGDNTVGELSELISKISQDIKEDGTLDNATYVSELDDNAANLDLTQIRENLEKRYQDLGLSISIPEFEDFVDSDGDGLIKKYDSEVSSPIGEINNTKPTFVWTESDYTNVTYKIEISLNSVFTDIVEQVSNLSQTTYTPSDFILSNDKHYFWRVAVVDENGVQGEWSEPGEFYVYFGDINLIYPLYDETISQTKPTFTWSAANLTEGTYKFELSSSDDYSTFIATLFHIWNETLFFQLLLRSLVSHG